MATGPSAYLVSRTWADYEVQGCSGCCRISAQRRLTAITTFEVRYWLPELCVAGEWAPKTHNTREGAN